MKELKKGYKDTEVGIIPEDWKILRVSEMTDIITGGTPSTSISQYWGGEYKWMSSGELNNKFIYDVEGRITELGLNNSSTHMLPINCVLIGLAGQGKTRGTVAINYCELCTNQSIAAILPQKEFIPLYLYYNLDNRYNELRASSTGEGGRGGLNKKILLDYLIPIPSIQEQQAIAKVLSDIDTLINSLNKQIEKKKNIKQGAMQELLSGKERLKEFTGEWEDYIIRSIGKPYNGISGKTKEDFGVGESLYIPFVNVLSNVRINTSQLEKVNILHSETQNAVIEGDLLFNTSSETPEEVGICSVIQEDIENLYLNSFCFGFRITNPDIDSLFLAYFFRSKEGRDLMLTLSQGSTRYNLSKSAFLKSIIQIPPTKEEQTAIAQILTDMDNEIEQLEKKRDKYLNIKSGMMQQLLTGQIRLI